MCLKFDSCINPQITEKLKTNKKPIIAYKVLRLNHRGELTSPWIEDTTWKIGKITKSDRKENKLSSREFVTQIVLEGIHCLKTREDARSLKRSLDCRRDISGVAKIFKVEINPKDLLMIGNDNDLVAYKVKLLQEIR